MLHYRFDWVMPEQEGETSRLLLIGDIFTHDARAHLEQAHGLTVDSISANTPLTARREQAERLLKQRRYTHIVLAQGRHTGDDAGEAPFLRALAPQAKLLSMGMLPRGLQKKQYRAPAPDFRARNAALRRADGALLDIAAEVERLGWTDGALALPAKLRYALTHAPAGNKLRVLGNFPSVFRNAAQQHLAEWLYRQLVQRWPELAAAPAAQKLSSRSSAIRWTNLWSDENNHTLYIGDSNARMIRRAGSRLSRRTDLYASSASPLAEPEAVAAALLPRHRCIIFSYGIHRAAAWEPAAFEQALRSLLTSWLSSGRLIILVGVTPCVVEGDNTRADTPLNAHIELLNGIVSRLASEHELPYVDLYSTALPLQHTDTVHFHRRAYPLFAAKVNQVWGGV